MQTVHTDLGPVLRTVDPSGRKSGGRGVSPPGNDERGLGYSLGPRVPEVRLRLNVRKRTKPVCLIKCLIQTLLQSPSLIQTLLQSPSVTTFFLKIQSTKHTSEEDEINVPMALSVFRDGPNIRQRP